MSSSARVALASLAVAVSVEAQAGQPFGQPFLGYYSGVGLDSIAASGVNAVAVAFSDPSLLANGPCNFSDSGNVCAMPTRLLTEVRSQMSALSQNTSPQRGVKPVVLVSFGGQSLGGGPWNEVFGSAARAKQFGENAAALALAVSSQFDVVGGIDLDVEGATSLPHMDAFMQAFRLKAPWAEVPLMLCSFSGLADPANAEHWKVSVMEQYGPKKQGFTWLNLMVDNQPRSCEDMSKYWLDERLDDAVPAHARVFGIWGPNLAAWTLPEPGCTDGMKLFEWMRDHGTGFGMWELWIGDATRVKEIADGIRMPSSSHVLI